MDKMFLRLDRWLKDLEAFSLPEWEQLPDIELYMDQVMSFLEKRLEPLMVEDHKLVTSFMINNYVKGGVIQAPNQKRYSREQIASLFMICFVKQVISLKDIALILRFDESENQSKLALYQYFKEIYNFTMGKMKEAMEEKIHRIQTEYQEQKKQNPNQAQIKQNAQREFVNFALELAIEAEITKTFAERILYEADLYLHDYENLEESTHKGLFTMNKEKRAAKKEEKTEQKAEKKKAKIVRKTNKF